MTFEVFCDEIAEGRVYRNGRVKSLEEEPTFFVGSLVSQEPGRRETMGEGAGPRDLLCDGKAEWIVPQNIYLPDMLR